MSEIKVYDPREERWNVITHAVGAALCPIGLAVLLYFAHSGREILACSLYAFSLFLMFAGSAAYHHAVNPARRALLRKFDHSNIYFLISGTYTPLMLLAVGGTNGTVILTISWTIAIVGITLEALGIKPFKGFSILLYVISGWLCIVILKELIAAMSPTGLSCLIAGGVFYTAGVFFYVSRKFFAHAIWHFFVIAGAVLHYLAILTLVC